MPDLSVGEFDALVLKAYRGAGFTWGMAQEAGRAAAWLAASGLPAARLFADLLSRIEGVNAKLLRPSVNSDAWGNNDQLCCPVMSGAALSDFGCSFANRESMQLGRVYSPAIVLPFVAQCAAADDVNLTLKVDGESLLVTAAGDTQVSDRRVFDLIEAEVSVTIAADCDIQSSPAVKTVSTSEEELRTLELLAHHTYVPASEQSRRSGAGAGLTDND